MPVGLEGFLPRWGLPHVMDRRLSWIVALALLCAALGILSSTLPDLWNQQVCSSQPG